MFLNTVAAHLGAAALSKTKDFFRKGLTNQTKKVSSAAPTPNSEWLLSAGLQYTYPRVSKLVINTYEYFCKVMNVKLVFFEK
jgi:hypothetical protein